ncbi:hypothetical protein CHS0354_030010 [Potamilus streckersoni]|uniref:CW-type domain-containing protein n=1 Tax=Potamilus streckersoni TaxID=2493646 RepID=A0AAE0SMX3_9BIVA|nr:hypothetical protein CHS0354_030010 [Potamilus streckersoni]
MAYEAGIRSSRVSPEFLHGNSTSHTWAFSAIAELIDNAYDPDVNAAELRIDTRIINGTECLTFLDNGNGMNQEKLHKMLSFGYCDKKQIGEIKPIGYYGNGFKSGSMRLGKDAIVFTRKKDSMSVGLLSQTFLKNINADTVLDYNLNRVVRKRRDDQNTTSNLTAILQHTIFKTEEELLAELSELGTIGHGTNIIIYNLRMTNENLELDFTSDRFDIRNPETSIIDLTSIDRPTIPCQPEYRRSLREYCSILYLKPRMKIVIRGKKVKTKLMSKSLSQTEMDRYKPTWLEQKIYITFGFTSSKNPDDYGIMMYHNNRLIKAFEKVGYQKQPNDLGVGVIGVVEANFLDPIHNKQDFNRTEKYSTFITNLSKKLNDYWNEKTSGGSKKKGTSTQKNPPDWTWAQCDNCLKWRRLPAGINPEDLPEKWYCHMNPDASFNRCDIAEEPEKEDEVLKQPVYKKTFRKKLKEKKRTEECEKMRKLQEKEQELNQREEALRRKSIQLSEEASSSEASEHDQSQPTQAGLDRTMKSPLVNKDRMKEEQTVRINLQKPKKIFQKQSHEMRQMTEQLKFSNINPNTAMLLDENSSSTVSFSSSVKRKLNDKDRPRKMFVEDDATITFVQNEAEIDNIFDLGNLQEMDEDEQQNFKNNISQQDVNPSMEGLKHISQQDVNPSMEGLKHISQQDVNPSMEGLKHISQQDLNPSMEGLEHISQDVKPTMEGLKHISQDVKPTMEELNRAIFLQKPNVELAHKTVQTVPVVIRSAAQDEVDLEKLSPLEKSHHLVAQRRKVCELQKKLEATNSRFKSLQGNICNLLKAIDPDFDCGQPDDIENVILDFIRVRVNAESD